MAWAWKQDVSPTDKLVLLALADHSDDDGQCWPGTAGISRKCHISQRTVFNSLARLESFNMVQRQHRKNGQGGLTSNLYQLTLPPLLNQIQYPPEPASVPLLNDVHSNHHIEPSLKRQKTTPLPPKGDDGFAQFWKAYPNRKAKGDAEKAWLKLKPNADLICTILAAIDRQKTGASWTKDGGQFIPLPATWLRGKRWEDEETATVPPPDEPGEFDHLPKINNNDYWICGCPKAGTQVCRSPVHGMTLEESCQFNAQARR